MNFVKQRRNKIWQQRRATVMAALFVYLPKCTTILRSNYENSDTMCRNVLLKQGLIDIIPIGRGYGDAVALAREIVALVIRKGITIFLDSKINIILLAILIIFCNFVTNFKTMNNTDNKYIEFGISIVGGILCLLAIVLMK